MKKIVCACLLFLITGIIPVQANEKNEKQMEVVNEYALTFMRESQCDNSIVINETKEMFDFDGNTTGYYLTFLKGEDKAGYLVMSMLTEDNPVVEFSFESWGILYPEKTIDDCRTEEVIYLGPDSYYYEMEETSVYSVYEKTIEDKGTIDYNYKEYGKYSEFIGSDELMLAEAFDSNGIKTWEQAVLNPSSIYKISHFGVGTDYWLMTDFSYGSVCAPTAATNILWYWGFKWNTPFIQRRVSDKSTYRLKAKKIFDSMYDSMATSYDYGTIDTNVLNGYSEFFMDEAGGGRWNYRYIPNGSSYNTYKNAFNDNCPVHLQARMNTNPFTTAGHDMFAFGYASGTDGTQYIFVMDGWNNGGRCVKYNYYPVLKGYKIWVNSSI